MMYVSHWGLQKSPFHNWPDPQRFYPSPTHDEALARLHFLIENRRRLGLLLGCQGSGKSMLLNLVARHLRRQGVIVALSSLLGRDTHQWLWNLAAELKLNPADAEPTIVLWRKITDCIVANRMQQLNTVLLLDDADQASETVVTDLLRLLQVDLSPDPWLTVVLAADAENYAKIGKRLLDLAELRIELEPWAPQDTAQFVQSSIEKAGGHSDVFSSLAASRLHQLSGGVPREVSQLAELSLLAGAGQGLQQVDGHTVESVFHELIVH